MPRSLRLTGIVTRSIIIVMSMTGKLLARQQALTRACSLKLLLYFRLLLLLIGKVQRGMLLHSDADFIVALSTIRRSIR